MNDQLTELFNNIRFIYYKNGYLLRLSFYRNQLELVKYLIDTDDLWRNNAFIFFSSIGNLQMVKYLFNLVSSYVFKKALSLSAANGHLDIVKLLIDNGTPINNYVLRHSAANGHLDIVKLLIDNGVSINEKKDRALRMSVKKGQIEMVKYLLKRGSNRAL